MNLAFFELEGWEEKIVRAEFPDEDVSFSKEKVTALSLPAVARDCEAMSVFVDSRIDKAALDAFPRLKFITTRSTGYDHIDLAACRERGVAVAYVPGYGDNTVAEFAFSLMLNLTRKTYQAIDQIKESGSFLLDGLRGVDIKGKTLGVVGTGRIGKEMIKIAKGFGMEVVAYDPMPDDNFAAAAGFRYMSFENLLRTADIISFHCPCSEKTRHLINKESIGFIKKGAYLVNTARGPIIETDALVEALRSGILAGAGLDVLEEEGETKDELAFLTSAHPKEDDLRIMLENHILMKMPNVLITPHNAFNSQEALERILRTTLDNIRGFIAGKPVNLVPMQ